MSDLITSNQVNSVKLGKIINFKSCLKIYPVFLDVLLRMVDTMVAFLSSFRTCFSFPVELIFLFLFKKLQSYEMLLNFIFDFVTYNIIHIDCNQSR